MGSQELNRTVQGDNGTLSTSTTGVIETNNYVQAEALAGSTYPLTADPTFTIQEWILLVNPGGKTVDLTTAGGDTITGLPLENATGAFDTLSIDSISINDPNGTLGQTSILLAGE